MLNEQALTNQMAGSWKDEFWTIIFGGILVACFVPYTQPYVKNGFDFLNSSTPGWFSTCLYICIGSSFGYRFGKTGLQLMNKKGILNIGGKTRSVYDFAKRYNPNVLKAQSKREFPPKPFMNLSKLYKIKKI